MKTIEVVAGVIKDQEGKILCVQRGESSKPYISKKWEFPGGKLELGESKEEALVRELNEELMVIVDNLEFLKTVYHDYPDFSIVMHVFTCKINSDEKPVLTEHLSYLWMDSADLYDLDWAAADVPIVETLNEG